MCMQGLQATNRFQHISRNWVYVCISQTKEMLPWDLGRPGYLLATLITPFFLDFQEGKTSISSTNASDILTLSRT